jgi:proline racemase
VRARLRDCVCVCVCVRAPLSLSLSLCLSVSVSVCVRAGRADGGMHYVIVDAASVGLAPLDPSRGREICRLGEMIKVATREQHPVAHPTHDYPGPDILVFREPATRRPAVPGGPPVLHARNTVVMSNGVLDWERPGTWTAMLDRSPCGTGTCAVSAPAPPRAAAPRRRRRAVLCDRSRARSLLRRACACLFVRSACVLSCHCGR